MNERTRDGRPACSIPGGVLSETELRVEGAPQSFAGVGRFDLLFEDQFQSNILMELKARPAKYEDATQLAKPPALSTPRPP